MIEWNHIMDKQPEHGRSVIQIDPPYKGHYCMGMRDYYQNCSFQSVLDSCKMEELPYPNFWWVYSEDFPFPDKL